MWTEADHPSIEVAARQVLEVCLAGPPTLDAGWLVCIDGPAGAGKTSLGEAVARASRGQVTSVALLHMDDLYEGWQGLGDVAARIRDDILRPLGQGEPGRYRRWDWHADRWAEEHVVDPVALLVLEGVGSGAREYAAAISTLVWVDAPAELRLQRGVERDGETMRAAWEEWQVDEEAHFATQRTIDRATILVDGTGETQPRVVRNRPPAGDGPTPPG